MSANAVYNSIKLETPPTVCSTQAASASEEEASRFVFFEFDRIAKGDEKGIRFRAWQSGTARRSQAWPSSIIHLYSQGVLGYPVINLLLTC